MMKFLPDLFERLKLGLIEIVKRSIVTTVKIIFQDTVNCFVASRNLRKIIQKEFV